MRQSTEIHHYYTKEDCDALDSMSLEEIIRILSGLEGTWMPGRPAAYYELSAGRTDEAEFDFDLLKANKAVDLAVRRLEALLREERARLEADAAAAPRTPDAQPQRPKRRRKT